MRYFLVSILILLAGQYLKAELTHEPLTPMIGDEVKFTYKSEEFNFENPKLIAYIFYEGDVEPTAKEMSLVSGSTSLFIPINARYAIFKVGDGLHFDDNKGKFWDIFIAGESGNPIEDSYLFAGISYLGSMPENCRRLVNYELAREYLKKEVSLYKGNIQAKIGLATVEFDLGEIDQDEFNDRIETHVRVQTGKESEGDIRAISRALRTLGRQNEASELEFRYARENKNSRLSEEIFLSSLSSAETLKDFTRGITEFLDTYPESQNKDRIYSALISGYLQVGNLRDLMKVFELQKDIPASAYRQLAQSLVDEKSILKDKSEFERIDSAMHYIDIAIELAKDPNNDMKPKYMADSEWSYVRNFELASNYITKATFYVRVEDQEKALETYRKAFELTKDQTTLPLYYDIIDNAVQLGKDSLALNFMSEAIVNSEYDSLLLENYPVVYKRVYPNSDPQKAIGQLQAQEYLKMQKEFERSEIDLDIKLGLISDLRDRKIDLDMQQGKVIVIDLWATWCGPCKESLPVFDEQSKKFEGNVNIRFIALNIWEESSGLERKNDILEFLEQSDLDVDIYINEDNKLPFRAGVTGLPTKIIIGKDNKIKFIENGFVDSWQYRREFEEKINYLLDE